MAKFVFTGQPDDCDGCTIRRVDQSRMPWKVDMFSTKGEGPEERLDQQMGFVFDSSFVTDKRSPLRVLLEEAKKCRFLRVTIETVEE